MGYNRRTKDKGPSWTPQWPTSKPSSRRSNSTSTTNTSLRSGGSRSRAARGSSSRSTSPKKGDTKIVKDVKYIFNGTKWIGGSPSQRPTTQTRTGNIRRRMGRNDPQLKPRAGTNYEADSSFDTGNRKTERQIAAEQAAARNPKPAKPAKPAARPAATKPAAKLKAKPSRPNPRMTGEGAPRPAAINTSSTAKKVSRLAKALADKKGMKSYMDRLRKKK